MVQYYSPANGRTKECLDSHNYGSGLKLMEHSWMKNNFVKTVESLIAEGGRWFNDPIIWSGDYGDHADNYHKNVKPIKVLQSNEFYRFLVNLDKKEYVDKTEVPEIDGWQIYLLVNLDKKQYVDKTEVPEIDGWQIHPLPLLTADGNGRGGGDYYGEDRDGLIGSWCLNRVIATNIEPDSDFTKIHFNLTEE